MSNTKRTPGNSIRVPDAWNDEDWDQIQQRTTPEVEDEAQEPRTVDTKGSVTAADPPVVLARKPPPKQGNLGPDDITTHMENMKIWNAANEGESFEVVGNSVPPGKTLYRPELKILKRATNTSSPERDPNKPNSDSSKGDDDTKIEMKRETPQEKMERERREREERYAKARERLFGPDTSGSNTPALMEKNVSSNGKVSGSSTPSGSKGPVNQHNSKTGSRKTSPSSKQRRRERIDDDFVPRSAMVAGTMESFQLDQQLQAEAQLRDMKGRLPFPQPPPQPPPASQYANYVPNFQNPPPAGNFSFPGPPPGQPPQGYDRSMALPHRPAMGQNNASWNTAYQPPSQPLHHSFNQFQGSNQHPPSFQAQQQQATMTNYQVPYAGQYHQQSPPGNSSPAHLPNLQQGLLYDPNYSQKPSTQFQSFGQGMPAGATTQYPVREPKAPDGTGRGGFGFVGRGSGIGVAPNLPQSTLTQMSLGAGYPSNMFHTAIVNQSSTPQPGGFNSPAAAAPWGVTGPTGSHRSPGQVWNNGSGTNGSNLNGPGFMSGSGYSGLGQNSVWGNSGTWGAGTTPPNTGQGPLRGKR